ncbi:MAG TPA: hypothetical protein VJ570_04780, partial [Holophagaceae bacterium]|nr:hypothetical protein [Holophagaceae bacterium]
MTLALGLGLVCLFLLPLPAGPLRALGVQVLGLILAFLTFAAGFLRARREAPPGRSLGLCLGAFGGLSVLYRLELLQRLFTSGAGLAVHPLRDALLWIVALVLLILALVGL